MELPFPLENEILKIGIDFNVMNCNAVVCVTAGNKLIVVDEIVKQQDTDAMAREIRRRYGNNKIFVYPDASGTARSTINASKTDIAIFGELWVC